VPTDLSIADPALVAALKVLPDFWSPEQVLGAVGETEVPIVHISGGD
jgi:hypothetical protein